MEKRKCCTKNKFF